MHQRLFDKATRAIEVVLALAFIAAVCMNFGNVVGRYFVGTTLGWADEVQVFIMIWMAFLGAVVVTWRGIHLRMDMLVKLFPLPLQKLLRFVELMVMIVACGLVVTESYKYAATMFKLDRVSDVGQIPMWIPHGGVALGFAMIVVIALVQLWDTMTSRAGPAARDAA